MNGTSVNTETIILLYLCLGLNAITSKFYDFSIGENNCGRAKSRPQHKASFWKKESLYEDRFLICSSISYKLDAWLDKKRKPLSVNNHTIIDIFSFANDLHWTKIDEHDILVSYDVSSLLTNVTADETIEILAERAFKADWFKKEYDLNITKADLIELLEVATKNQLFQFEGNPYEQVDGVAMGSPFGPLMPNAFMCNIEEQLINQHKMPAFYKRYCESTKRLLFHVWSVRCRLCWLHESTHASTCGGTQAINNRQSREG